MESNSIESNSTLVTDRRREFVTALIGLYNLDRNLYYRYYTSDDDLNNSLFMRIISPNTCIYTTLFEIIYQGKMGEYVISDDSKGYQLSLDSFNPFAPKFIINLIDSIITRETLCSTVTLAVVPEVDIWRCPIDKSKNLESSTADNQIYNPRAKLISNE